MSSNPHRQPALEVAALNIVPRPARRLFSQQHLDRMAASTQLSGSEFMGKSHSSRFLQIVDRARGEVRECTVQDVVDRSQRNDEITLLDVREESEFAQGHIPGALHLGKGVIERDVEQRFPNPSTELILYCGGGYRSALAALNLQLMGYTNVISMDGGFRGWKEANQPVTVPGSE